MTRESNAWLVVRLSALGDVVLTTGVLDHWHRERGWTFDVLTRSSFAPVFLHNPAVDHVEQVGDTELHGRAWVAFCRRLAAAHKGCGLIDLHGTGRTFLLGLFWHGPVRRYAKLAFARRCFLLSGGRFCGDCLRSLHVTQRYALAVDAAAPAIGELRPHIYLSDEELEAGRACVAVPETEPLVALHPYAAHAGKRWPADHWLELITALQDKGLAWYVLGRCSPEERLPGIPANHDWTNRCDLRQSAAFLAASSVLITGDSGPMHLAAAVGTPVVALFGSTTREWGFSPAGSRDIVLERTLRCRPCTLHGGSHCDLGHACLRDIAVEQVLAALERVILRR